MLLADEYSPYPLMLSSQTPLSIDKSDLCRITIASSSSATPCIALVDDELNSTVGCYVKMENEIIEDNDI